MNRLGAVGLLLAAFSESAAVAQSSASYRVGAALQDGGSSASAGYRVTACLGAAPAGTSASASYRVESGCAWGAGVYAALPHGNVASGGGTQSTPVNQAFPQPLAVTVIDPFGAPVAGATVAFSSPGSGASCAFSGGGTAATDASGVASVIATANGTTGSYQVAASVSGLPAVSFSLTNAVVPVELQRFAAE